MEQVGEEVVVNDIGSGVEFQGKECNLALEVGGDSALTSPVMCPLMRTGNRPEGLAGYSGGQDLNRCVLSVAGSESSRTGPYTVRNGGKIVEELTMQNCRNLNHALAASADADKGSLSGAVMARPDLPLKTLGGSSLPPMLVRRVAKGKGVVNRNQEAVTEFGDALGGQVDENMVYARRIASNALMRSSARDNHIARRVGRSSPESSHHAVSLREWLKPSSNKKEKAESISIFKQIVELVDLAHSQGLALEDLSPSCFNILPSNKVVYVSLPAQRQPELLTFRDYSRKRQLEQDKGTSSSVVVKQQKLGVDNTSLRQRFHFESNCDINSNAIDSYTTHHRELGCVEIPFKNRSNCQNSSVTTGELHNSLIVQLEQKWYKSPEQLNGGCATFLSNIYSLGVLLFELLCWFESYDMHFSAMEDLQKRILPPKFLSESSWEAGFCLWLLHPTSSSRPTAREILQSELIRQSPELCYANVSKSSDEVDAESEMLLHFLNLLKDQKQKHASKLVKNIEYLDEDINEVEKKHLTTFSSEMFKTQEKILDAREKNCGISLGSVSRLFSSLSEVTIQRNIEKIEDAYFSIRSQIHVSSAPRVDKGLLKNRDTCYPLHEENSGLSINQKSVDPLGVFFDGLCKFARYHKLEVCGSLRNRDLLGSTNAVCSLSFDRDEDYIAAARVSKKIKIFEFETLLNDSVDVHYPVVELLNNSKLSCVCWNNYIKNYLASTDYDGVVQMWDAGTGQGFSHYREHQKRAWSVDFSLADPMMFASGSDDCSVKLWSLNERDSVGTIWSPANVCSVQFSAYSNNLLVFGSADYNIYCYDLRHTRIPWCTLGGHEKAVSYMKFLDSETLVSASTDNSLKLWDLNKTNSIGLSTNACTMTFSGHTNEKNFVGLSSLDGYIACGSETNEVYCYYKSLPMPITSHKFNYVEPISGKEMGDDNGQFVSSVCWRQKSKIVVAANSSGNMKLLQLV